MLDAASASLAGARLGGFPLYWFTYKGAEALLTKSGRCYVRFSETGDWLTADWRKTPTGKPWLPASRQAFVAECKFRFKRNSMWKEP